MKHNRINSEGKKSINQQYPKLRISFKVSADALNTHFTTFFLHCFSLCGSIPTNGKGGRNVGGKPICHRQVFTGHRCWINTSAITDESGSFPERFRFSRYPVIHGGALFSVQQRTTTRYFLHTLRAARAPPERERGFLRYEPTGIVETN